MFFESRCCPTCGGRVKNYNPYTRTGRCEYCGMDVVSSAEPSEADRLVDCALKSRGFGELEKAAAFAHELAERHPQDFRAWKLDYALHANHSAAGPYDPKPLSIRRMCATAMSVEDAEFLSDVGAELARDKASLVQRLEALGSDMERVRELRPSVPQDTLKAATETDLGAVDRKIADLKRTLQDIEDASSGSALSCIKTFAATGWLLLWLALMIDGCSKGDAASAYGGVVLAPLGGLLFGVPLGALAGAIAGAASGLLRTRARNAKARPIEEQLAILSLQRQYILLELGRAAEATALGDEVMRTAWSIAKIDTLVGEIDSCITRF